MSMGITPSPLRVLRQRHHVPDQLARVRRVARRKRRAAQRAHRLGEELQQPVAHLCVCIRWKISAGGPLINGQKLQSG